MKKMVTPLIVLAIVAFVFGTACTSKEQGKKGAALFQQNCSPCHPNGSNIVNSQKTLHKKDREANGVMSDSDIVGKMRNPGPGMTKFGENTIPDKDAKEIAEYVLKTFQ
jgi:cytochrome c6